MFVHSTVGSMAYVEFLIPGSISGTCNNVDHCLFEILFSPTLYSNTLRCLCLVAQLHPTLYDPMDCSPPGSSVHGILQARILEWAAISFSRGSSQPRDQTCVSYISLHWQVGSLPLVLPGKLTSIYTCFCIFKNKQTNKQTIVIRNYCIAKGTQYSKMTHMGIESNEELIYVYA